MEPTDYRLERWIAFVLFLLFFLPFVANADEVLYTDRFHGDEVKAKSGESYLALVCREQCVLQPVKIAVEVEFDPILDAEGEATGKRVSAVGVDDAFLLQSKRLQPGLVTAATPRESELLPVSKPQAILLGRTKSVLHYRCGSAPDPEGFVDCALVLESGGATQVLANFPAYDDGGKLTALDIAQCVFFAGDLDHDGKLDLLANVSGDWNTWHPALFLSTAANEGELVGRVAEMIATGC